jgi:crotonobetainyl-CoA:carnitine CoA-transferase CaiB-like acyl-CoA transferase
MSEPEGQQLPKASGEHGTKPLDGVRVLEVAMYGFVPSAGAVLADRARR